MVRGEKAIEKVFFWKHLELIGVVTKFKKKIGKLSMRKNFYIFKVEDKIKVKKSKEQYFKPIIFISFVPVGNSQQIYIRVQITESF